MDTNHVHKVSGLLDDVDTDDLKLESETISSLIGISYKGEVGVLGKIGEVLTKVEVDSACSSEKLLNLSILMMHVATRENDVEAFVSEKDHILVDRVEEVMEFDLLSGILDSEVRELDKFIVTLHREIVNARETISSCKQLGETFMVMEEKLCDSEESLKQSQDQVSEIMMQSDKFQRTLPSFIGEGNCNTFKGDDFIGDDHLLNTKARIKMQTAEQQRHILRMLEKSLAREMDLEKKLSETKLIEEELQHRLHSSEQELFCMEDEATDVWERLFEADNVAEVLTGISKELLGRLQVIQFNLNGSVQREAGLRSKLEAFKERLEAKEGDLMRLDSNNTKLNDFLLAQLSNLKASLQEAKDKSILASSEAFTLREKVSLLEMQLRESDLSDIETVIEDLKLKLSQEEKRVDDAEGRCKLLTETNMDLNEELDLLKRRTSEKMESVERQLRESETKLQYAVASAEASQEKQNMLYASVGDMENLIDDLKLKVSKAGTRADDAEQKCIMLSEANAELHEELGFLRGRMEFLETSLQKTEQTKVATAKDIKIRARVIMDLVMELASERERLHKQVSSLRKENNILVVKLHKKFKDFSVDMSDFSTQSDKDSLFSKGADYLRQMEGDADDASFSRSQDQENAFVGKTEGETIDPTSEAEMVRRIDAGLLTAQHVLMAILILLISAVVYMFWQKKCPI